MPSSVDNDNTEAYYKYGVIEEFARDLEATSGYFRNDPTVATMCISDTPRHIGRELLGLIIDVYAFLERKSSPAMVLIQFRPQRPGSVYVSVFESYPIFGLRKPRIEKICMVSTTTSQLKIFSEGHEEHYMIHTYNQLFDNLANFTSSLVSESGDFS